MGAAQPGFFQRRGRQVAAVGAGDGGPEVQAVGVVDGVESGHVDVRVLPFRRAVDVLRHKAEEW